MRYQLAAEGSGRWLCRMPASPPVAGRERRAPDGEDAQEPVSPDMADVVAVEHASRNRMMKMPVAYQVREKILLQPHSAEGTSAGSTSW